LTITQVDGQAIADGGTSVAVTNGTVALVAGQLVFTPASNYNGPASFTYTISDGALTSTATVSGTVTPANDAPVAVDDSFTVTEDASVTINVLGNDSDVDGDSLTITQVDGQAIADGGTSVAVTNGTVALVSGQLVFTPTSDYNGPASFAYTISDGALTSTATASGTVTAVNDAPVAVDDSFTVTEDGAVTINVVGNDSDVDGDSLTVTQVDGQAVTDGGASVAVTNGTVALVSGQLVFTPGSNYNGPASFTYTISDGALTSTATVTGIVTPVNNAPVALNDGFTVAEGGSVTINVLANDSDVDGEILTITHVNGQSITDGGPWVAVANGSVALVSGELVFKPAPGHSGSASFTYTITDGLASTTATIQGKVTLVYDPPPPHFPAAPAVPERPVPVVQVAPSPVVGHQAVEVRAPVVTAALSFSSTAIPPITPEIHVLNAVESSRVESSLLANGMTMENSDTILMAEAMSQTADNMLLDQRDDAVESVVMKEVGGERWQQGVKPVVYVQHAVRHEPLMSDHGLFVQRAVRASQLQSRVDDMRISELSVKLGDGTPWSVDDPASVALQGAFTPEIADPAARNLAPSRLAPDPAQEIQDPGAEASPERRLSSPDAASETGLNSAAKGFRSQLRDLALQRRGVALPLAPRAADHEDRPGGRKRLG
jgi:hypothetical protein